MNHRNLVRLLSLLLIVLAGGWGGSAVSSAAGPDGMLARQAGGSRQQALVRTYTDSQGRSIRLLEGRGTGRRGDWGWAHIVDKHIRGHWLDGGVVTTFPQALGTTTEDQVQELIGTTLAQSTPRSQGRRRIYAHSVAGGSGRVKVVVGSDGTIITAYPER